jgi:hypothetical protein
MFNDIVNIEDSIPLGGSEIPSNTFYGYISIERNEVIAWILENGREW